MSNLEEHDGCNPVDGGCAQCFNAGRQRALRDCLDIIKACDMYERNDYGMGMSAVIDQATDKITQLLADG